jgi:hypothetical protein
LCIPEESPQDGLMVAYLGCHLINKIICLGDGNCTTKTGCSTTRKKIKHCFQSIFAIAALIV